MAESSDDDREYHLPTEAVNRIYHHLDYKSMVRSSCVAKQWHSVVEDERVWARRFRTDFGAEPRTDSKRKEYNLEWHLRYGEPECASFWLDERRSWHLFRSYAIGIDATSIVGVDLETMAVVERIEGGELESKSSVAVCDRIVFVECKGSDNYSWFDLETGVEVGPQDEEVGGLVSCDGIFMVYDWLEMFKISNMLTREYVSFFGGHNEEEITCLKLKGDRLVSGAEDEKLKLWDVTEEECLNTFTYESTVTCVDLNSDRVYGGSSEGHLKVWDVKSGKSVVDLNCHPDGLRTLFFDDTKILTANGSKINMWDARKYECVREIDRSNVDNVQYDGRNIYMGNGSGYIRRCRFD